MEQLELDIGPLPAPKSIPINGKCSLERDSGKSCEVHVNGLVFHAWNAADSMAESYAMVSLVLLGYAAPLEVAKAFGVNERTVFRRRDKFELYGMVGLGNSRGRPEGAKAGADSRIKMAQAMREGGATVRDIAHRLGVGIGTVSRWTKGPSMINEKETSGQIPEVIPGNTLDTNPQSRDIDRILARTGLLFDAEPVFIPGKKIPYTGVLLAVPALSASGIFKAAEKVYGHIGPAFYGLRTTVLVMLLMALMRIKRPEALKEYAPPDLGRIIGLDRMPEVKTLRRKILLLSRALKGEEFGRILAEERTKQRGKALGFLYIDGHVRVYHGKRRVPKAYVTRLRMALPATTDYWVNDQEGDPLFVVTADMNASLTKMLPVLLKEIRGLVGERRVTVVFDRGGWSPRLFVKLIDGGFDILTYRKGKTRKIPQKKFTLHTEVIEGREITYNLNDKNIRLLNGKLRLRQITRLSDDEKHQTYIVTSRTDLPAAVLAYRMFERWRQENFFKYMNEEFALDALIDYAAEEEDEEKVIPNPERRKINKKLAGARAELRKAEHEYGRAAMEYNRKKNASLREFKESNKELELLIEKLEKKVRRLEEKQKKTPERIAVGKISGEKIMRLQAERKHITSCIKMVAYQAESDLLALVRPHYARADAEGRTLITSALQSSADIDVRKEELFITLAPLSSAHRTRAIAGLCETLNQTKTCFPGTKLKLRFGVAETG
jgi:hypothetical protein